MPKIALHQVTKLDTHLHKSLNIEWRIINESSGLESRQEEKSENRLAQSERVGIVEVVYG
jgi:hypothetical protein